MGRRDRFRLPFSKALPPVSHSGNRGDNYKGRIKDKAFASTRLSDEPHYFGKARIGKIYADRGSDKGDLSALIEGFTPFERAVPAKSGGGYLETIPAARLMNYWRDGVRPVSEADYDLILSHAKLLPTQVETDLPDVQDDPLTFISANEGTRQATSEPAMSVAKTCA